MFVSGSKTWTNNKPHTLSIDALDVAIERRRRRRRRWMRKFSFLPTAWFEPDICSIRLCSNWTVLNSAAVVRLLSTGQLKSVSSFWSNGIISNPVDSYAMETYREMLHRISTFDVVIKHRDRIGSQAWLWFFVAIDSMRWISSDNYWKINREGIFFFTLPLLPLLLRRLLLLCSLWGRAKRRIGQDWFLFFFSTWSLLCERLGCLSGADLNCGRIVDV